MIKKGIIESGQIIFVYSQPWEEALIGYVDEVDYPFVSVRVIPRSLVKNKFGKIQKLDISKNIPLTIFTDEYIEEFMTNKEIKCLKKFQKEANIVDLFSGNY